MIKSLKEYQELAQRTCPDLGSEQLNIEHMMLGIFTEYGELCDVYKKHLAYGRDVDFVNVQEEFADQGWYIINLFRIKGIEIDIRQYFEFDNVRKENINFQLIYFMKSLYTAILDDDMIYLLSSWWYLGLSLNVDIFKALTNNIDKLKIRYPDKFDEEKALNRDLESEKKELEK